MTGENLLLGVAWLVVAFGAYTCARLTRPDRNYYPMQRVIWAALGFVGMGAGLGAIVGRVNTVGSRLTFAAVLLAAIAYSIRFMRKRNATPRYIVLTILGQDIPLDEEHLRRQAENVTSIVRHGAAPEPWVRGLEEACAEWRRLERWKAETLPGQLAARREAQDR